MLSRSPSLVLRAWETAASYPRSIRGAVLLACLEEADAVSIDRFARLPIGERDARLLAWRERLFGREIRALVECPRCGESIELTFDAPSVDTLGVGESKERHFERAGVAVEFRLLDSLDLSSIDGDASSARTQLLEQSVVSARDANGNAIAVSSIPDDVIDELSSRVALLDPLADIQLDAQCDSCGHAWEAPFDAGAFLWAEIDGAARRLLVDVHDLAVSYGWSEAEILSLTPERRQAYLELVRG